MAPNQRMTSAPEPSSFRQQFQDRGRNSEYDPSTSRKDGQLATGMGFSHALPAGKEPLGEGRHVGKVVDNNRLHGFMVGHKDSTEFSQGSGGGNQINQRVASQVGADNFQGASNKSEITDFLNSWNRIGRARPKTSDASRQRRQRSQIPKVNSNRRRGTNKSNLVTEDLMIISMSPISIKARSKEDIFRLGDFDKHVTPANPNNAQRSDDSNSTQLPPFGGYPSLSGDSSKKQFYYGKKVNQVETKENIATQCCTQNYCSHL